METGEIELHRGGPAKDPLTLDGEIVAAGADLGDLLTRAAARHGIDLAQLDPALSPMDPRGNIIEGAEAVEFFAGNAEKALRKVMDGVFADGELPPLVEPVRLWITEHCKDPAEAPFLLLRGITGCGKTSQSIGLLNQLVHWYAGHGRRFTWYFITHREFSAAMQPGSGRDPDALMLRLMSADLVILSDLGDVNNQDFGRTQDKTSRLINHRYHHKLPLVCETNLPFVRGANAQAEEEKSGNRIAVLADYIDDRAISRLRGGWKVTLPAIDHRAALGRSFTL